VVGGTAEHGPLCGAASCVWHLAFNAIAYERASAAVLSFSDVSAGRGWGCHVGLWHWLAVPAARRSAAGAGASQGEDGAGVAGTARAGRTNTTIADNQHPGRAKLGGGSGESLMATWQLLIGPGSRLSFGDSSGSDDDDEAGTQYDTSGGGYGGGEHVLQRSADSDARKAAQFDKFKSPISPDTGKGVLF